MRRGKSERARKRESEKIKGPREREERVKKEGDTKLMTEKNVGRGQSPGPGIAARWRLRERTGGRVLEREREGERGARPCSALGEGWRLSPREASEGHTSLLGPRGGEWRLSPRERESERETGTFLFSVLIRRIATSWQWTKEFSS